MQRAVSWMAGRIILAALDTGGRGTCAAIVTKDEGAVRVERVESKAREKERERPRAQPKMPRAHNHKLDT
jgi:hypothetical protein